MLAEIKFCGLFMYPPLPHVVRCGFLTKPLSPPIRPRGLGMAPWLDFGHSMSSWILFIDSYRLIECDQFLKAQCKIWVTDSEKLFS